MEKRFRFSDLGKHFYFFPQYFTLLQFEFALPTLFIDEPYKEIQEESRNKCPLMVFVLFRKMIQCLKGNLYLSSYLNVSIKFLWKNKKIYRA